MNDKRKSLNASNGILRGEWNFKLEGTGTSS